MGDMPWEVMPDLFFYRDPEEVEKEDRERAEAAGESQMTKAAEYVAPPKEEWGGDEVVTDWSADGQAPAAAPVAAPAAAAAPAVAAFQVTDDWAAQTESSDWAAQSAPEAATGPTWGGSSQW